MPEKINKIFSSSDVKHGLSLFTLKEMESVENMIIEKDGNFYIRCQIKDKYKVAKPE
jgi:type I restriction enzyme M protein